MKVSPVVWPPAPREAAKVRKILKSSKYFKFYSKFSAAFDTDRVLKRAVVGSELRATYCSLFFIPFFLTLAFLYWLLFYFIALVLYVAMLRLLGIKRNIKHSARFLLQRDPLHSQHNPTPAIFTTRGHIVYPRHRCRS